MNITRIYPVTLALLLISASLSMAQVVPTLAQADKDPFALDFRSPSPQRTERDADLEGDESLEDLMKIEYDKDAWSMGTAIGLSLIPGGGFGLLYARKKPQAVIPFLLSTVGYGLGIAYIAGAFDESQSSICTHTSDGRVAPIECTYADIPPDPSLPNRIDNSTIDPRDPNAKPYWQTAGDYTRSTAGRNYSGRQAGITILAATYLVSSTLGAVWSGMSVGAHNRQLRRDIESTAGMPSPQPVLDPYVEARPFLNVTSERSTFGVRLNF